MRAERRTATRHGRYLSHAGVLIPRPETEQLLDLVQAAVAARPQLRGGRWADLGTGSGAIAFGLASILSATAEASAAAVVCLLILFIVPRSLIYSLHVMACSVYLVRSVRWTPARRLQRGLG